MLANPHHPQSKGGNVFLMAIFKSKYYYCYTFVFSFHFSVYLLTYLMFLCGCILIYQSAFAVTQPSHVSGLPYITHLILAAEG